MGNSHSQQHQFLNHQWTQSYPRTRHVQPHVKVLPERLPPLRLRTTDNGAILQNGGTLSSKKQSLVQEERTYRPRSSSAHRPPKLGDINLDKTRYGSEPDLRFHLKDSRDQYGENAIRHRISRSRKKYKAPPAPQNGVSSGMESSSSDLNGWESNNKDCTNLGPKKARLFKTRAETNKKNLQNPTKFDARNNENLSKSTEILNSFRSKYREERLQKSGTDVEAFNKNEQIDKKQMKRSMSHEVISTNKNLATPEFQTELLEAAQRLRPMIETHHSQNRIEAKIINTNISKGHCRGQVKGDAVLIREVVEGVSDADQMKQKKKCYPNQSSKEDSVNHSQLLDKERTDRGKQCNQTAEQKKNKPEREVPSKKFYFGMENDNNAVITVNNYLSTNNVDKTNAEHRITAVAKDKNLMNLYKCVADNNQEWEDSVDKFAANFHKSRVAMPNGNTTSCSSSFVSDPDEDVDGGIALQLRPTLPKKQLEIPRFSPTAAWRLLSSIDTACPQAPSPDGSEDIPVLFEDRIHPPMSQQVLRSSHDKSGDSGISGDASPGGCQESSSEIAVTSGKVLTSQNSKNVLKAWTPQQDLEEESSSDDLECPVSSSKTMSKIPGAKFSPRSQLFLTRDHSFSMSLPRDDRRMSPYGNNEEQEKGKHNLESSYGLNSLQKFKVTMKTSKRPDADENSRFQSDNWVLSRSVPSSLNNHAAIAKSVSNPSSPEQDDEYSQHTSLKYPSYSYLGHGGRMMYLPEYQSRISPDMSGSKEKSKMRNGFLSKSCENITQTGLMKQPDLRSRSPSPKNDSTNAKDDFSHKFIETRSNQKKKKFTFQSTVRLLENKKLAERLSREAELKENQRLSEIEAMKKVEEEFQKKRAREKASIRHQLRLFSLEEKNFNSLPQDEREENGENSEESPTSLPAQVSNQPQFSKQCQTSNRKTSVSSDGNKVASTTQILSEYRETIRNYRDYRQFRYQLNITSLDYIKLPALRYHEASSPENNRRSFVEHPRVVYDMPKSTPVYVSASVNSLAQNHYKEETRGGGGGGVSTPRSSSSDNYRKDFAHGALPPSGRSHNSSDSEMSQSQLRSASCQRITSRGLNSLHNSRYRPPSRTLLPPPTPYPFEEYERVFVCSN